MPAPYERKRPDLLQKLFLYLILFDWVILIYLVIELKNMSFRYGAMTSIMVALFNLILVNLCFRRARRAEDSYQIYPVIIGALMSFALIAYFFFFFF
ncbi:hypothetical protein JK628_01100 [Shewanella sp. KX20019]|uniref:hypothetical protein n=1 Tax=Shewanella sp. KX20019 TaxID=2803864 RepID=UPI001926433E|nr:hypothetical protein [Shewanella sp. KX20019]QQX80509.1 hypothetical protein JK628_01100 [Shewanella sp. KX20019]